MKRYLLFFFITICAPVFSQGSANLWYFGFNGGTDFSAGTATSISGGQLTTIEGCSSISSENGELLFYTNGQTVWSKNHVVMQNGTGLFADLSSSQAAVIVKKPDSEHTYYIFTTNALMGLRYSEVNLAANDGFGSVVSKNNLLYQPTCEKIAIVKHGNCDDFWAVTHVYGTDEFRSFRISHDGVNNQAVSSHVGSIVTTDDDHANAIGYLKISPDGKKLAICHTYLMQAELFDFNASTGIVSNPLLISNEGAHVYGAEFSTSSDMLYVSAVDEKKLFQFNLRAEDIAASRMLLATTNATAGALQMGPDGKIYLAMAETNYLSVINNPDLNGNAAGFSENAVQIEGTCMLGLPSFNASLFDRTIRVQNICSGGNTHFTVGNGQIIGSVAWNFGDGNTSDELSPNHNYAVGGNYTVMATITSGNSVVTKSEVITIISAPEAHAIAAQNLCIMPNQPYHLADNNTAILNGQASDDLSIAYYQTLGDAENSTNPISDYILQTGSITFYAKVSNTISGCNSITSFTVISSPPPTAATPSDYIVCDNFPYDGSAEFDLSLKNTEILGGQDNSLFHVTYFINTADAENNSNAIGNTYVNSTEEETIFARVSNFGETCYVIVPLHLIVAKQPKPVAVSDYVICDDSGHDGLASFDLKNKTSEILDGLSAEDFTVSYFTSMSNAQSNTTPISGIFTNTEIFQTIYVRIESTHGCAEFTSFHLDAKNCDQPLDTNLIFPKYFSPNGDGANDFWQVTSRKPTNMKINIFDRNGKLLWIMSSNDKGWDGMINGSPLPASDYWYSALENGMEYRGHFSLMR